MRKFICAIALLFIIHAGPTSGTPPDLPGEPDYPSIHFVGWSPLPNGLLDIYYDLDLDGKIDYITTRVIIESGEKKTEEDIIAMIPNWPKSVIVYFYDSAMDSYRYYICHQYPLFIFRGGIKYIDSEEDGINGNEIIYDSLFKSERQI